MRARPITALAVLTALTLFAAACGSDNDSGSSAASSTTASPSSSSQSSDSTDASDQECVPGQDSTLDIATFVEPLGFDPIVASGGSYGGLELAAIYDTLMRWNPDTKEFEPWLAKDLTANADSTDWTLTLRDGVTFANGDPLTAEAVTASIARHMDPENRSNLGNLVAPVQSMDTPDDLTVVFHLDKPWPGFPFALANTPGMITNPAVVAERGDLKADPNGAGVGPYQIERNAPGEELVLSARDNYWGGEVCVPKLRFVRISGAQATYDAFQSGEIDVAMLRDPRVLKEARADGMGSQGWVMNLGEMLIINHGVQGSTPVTTDVRIRQAVAAAINVEDVDQRVNQGMGYPTSAISSPDSGLDQTVPGPAYDPERAKELVAEAKADGWDGSIRLACDNAPNRQEIALSIEAQLRAAGFTVVMDGGMPINAQLTKVFQADFDLACWGINVHAAGPWAKLDKQLGGPSASNFAGFIDDEWDAALDALRAAATPAEQVAAMDRLQDRWNEVIPVINLAAIEEAFVWGPDVIGLVPSAESLMLFGNVRLS